MRSPNRSNLLPDADWNRNHARMALRRSLDRVSDRQGGIRREPEPPPVVELLGRSREREVPFLDEVEQRNALTGVLTGDPDDETKVSLDQKPFCMLVAGCLATEEFPLLGPRENRHPFDSAGV